jgi:signal transduction histidine kinase/CheY-like chemotaxis protein
MASKDPRLPLIFIAAAWLAAAQPSASLREIHVRQPPGFASIKIGAHVAVEGVVSTKAIKFGEFAHLPIVGHDGTGLLIEGERGGLDRFSPGDVVRATGRITQRTGMPVLLADEMAITGHAPEPRPERLRVNDVAQFGSIGKYVTLDASVVAVTQNGGGDVLTLASGRGSATIMVFFPRYARWDGPGLTAFTPGDKILVTGIASQYCPVEPFDRGFQIVVDSPAQVHLLERAWGVPPTSVLYLFGAFVLASGAWSIRERRMADQRRTLRSLMSLSEEVLSSNSVGDIGRKVRIALPPLLGGWDIQLFLLNKVRNTLDRIPNDLSPDEISISYQQPRGAFGSAVAICFRNRTLLNIPDFQKSPILETPSPESDLPRSATFVPMLARGEILGVMAVVFRARPKSFHGQQAALQHVANQIAAALKLQEQQSIREQLLRTEKMAAAGQLISGVAHDLREPLNSIRSSAESLAGTATESAAKPLLSDIMAEADRGLQIVNHLLAFARMERAEARSVNLHQLVSNVMEAREPEWRRKGIELDNGVPVVPVDVFVEEGEIEQVFLSLLIHIEHAVQNHPAKHVRLSSRVLGSRVQVSIDFPGTTILAATADKPATEDSFSLRVCQAIVQSHGGDIRLYLTAYDALRYELELPVYHPPTPREAPAEPIRRPSRVLTAILVEPDAGIQRRLLAMLSARGHRAIPVDSPDEAADLIQRMPFDVVFCTMRLPGLNWMEFHRRIRRKIATFVLLSDSSEPDSGTALKDGTGFILHKPLAESELETVLAEVESANGLKRQ